MGVRHSCLHSLPNSQSVLHDLSYFNPEGPPSLYQSNVIQLSNTLVAFCVSLDGRLFATHVFFHKTIVIK